MIVAPGPHDSVRVLPTQTENVSRRPASRPVVGDLMSGPAAVAAPS